MTRLLFALFFVFYFSQSALADMYLQYLLNYSNEDVSIKMVNPPFGWVLPKYPQHVSPNSFIADEKAYDKVKDTAEYYTCIRKVDEIKVKKVSNIALPESCDSNKSYIQLDYKGKKKYRFFTCKSKVYADEWKKGDWKNLEKVGFKGSPIDWFWVVIGPDGELMINAE